MMLQKCREMYHVENFLFSTLLQFTWWKEEQKVFAKSEEERNAIVTDR